MALAPGTRLGHYEVLAPLGAGGMGVVYRAEDPRLGREVALKFLPESLAQRAAALERFQREARAASALNHPNICTVHDIGGHAAALHRDGAARRRDAAGASWRQPLPRRRSLDLGIQIADALDARTRRGIVHRDLKPAERLRDRGRHAKLLDFGLAKLTLGAGVVRPSALPTLRRS